MLLFKTHLGYCGLCSSVKACKMIYVEFNGTSDVIDAKSDILD